MTQNNKVNTNLHTHTNVIFYIYMAAAIKWTKINTTRHNLHNSANKNKRKCFIMGKGGVE